MSTEKQNKIFFHPEKEEIIKKLLSGESVKNVESWLKTKHPRKKRLWVSYMTLQKFRKEYLHLEGEVLENIKAAKQEMDEQSDQAEAKLILSTSSAYQKKLNEIVSKELDANRKILEMMALVSSRIEVYFNSLDTKSSIQGDKLLIELLNAQRGLVQDWKKYVEKVADQKIEHNINVNVVNEQVTVLKNIVFEILQELDPALVPYFIEKVNSRLGDLQYGSNNYETYSKAKVLDIINAE